MFYMVSLEPPYLFYIFRNALLMCLGSLTFSLFKFGFLAGEVFPSFYNNVAVFWV
jgi:hypothetical protein